MPAKKSNPEKRSTEKKKSSAKGNATARVAERRGTRGKTTVAGSQKQRSQGRFPNETPLTGEDRPKNRAGGKQRGYSTGAKGRTAAG